LRHSESRLFFLSHTLTSQDIRIATHSPIALQNHDTLFHVYENFVESGTNSPITEQRTRQHEAPPPAASTTVANSPHNRQQAGLAYQHTLT